MCVFPTYSVPSWNGIFLSMTERRNQKKKNAFMPYLITLKLIALRGRYFIVCVCVGVFFFFSFNLAEVYLYISISQ